MIQIVTLLGGIRATIFAALCVALAATVVVQSVRLSRAQDQRDRWIAESAAARDANTANMQTIDDLREANRKWTALADATKRDADAAVLAVRQERDALQDELDRRRADRGAVYENEPDAAAWGRTRVPDGIAAGLRK